MPFLKIRNSDGDVYLDVTDRLPEVEGQMIKGVDFLRDNNDSNYWPEEVVVVVWIS